MTDILPDLKLHRARRQMDAEIERYNKLSTALHEDDYLGGVVLGLIKARSFILTTEEQNESWRLRREMFG